MITVLLASVVLIGALLRTPWHRLTDSSAQHVLFGACVATLLLWTLQIDFGSGLALHFLGITTLTLMFGWPLALVAGAIVTVASPLADLGAWTNLPGVFVSQCAIPAAVTWQIYRVSLRRMPHNFFVYIFVCAFSGGALAMTAATLAQVLLWSPAAGDGLEQAAVLARFLPLYAYPEAFLNGFVMTGLVVTRPQWVMSFDDAVYLRGK